MEENKNKFLNKKIKRDNNEKASNKKIKGLKQLETKKTTSLQTIKSYKEKKMKEWKSKIKEDLQLNDLKEFVTKSYDIHNESQILYINKLIINHKEEFISHYSKYQFVLDLSSRKEFQNKMKNDDEIMKIPMIKNNIIPDDCSSIRIILIKLLNDINEIELNIDNDINNDNINLTVIKIFLENHVYFNSVFNYLIPTKYSDNFEYKYNKILFDVAHFFFPWDGILEAKDLKIEEKNIISKKILLLGYISSFIEKMNLFADEDLIESCEYLLNLIEIMSQVKDGERNYSLFQNIVKTCLPFDLIYAKKKLKEMKDLKYFYSKLIINNTSIKFFNPDDLKENSEVKLVNNNGRQFTVKANEINWYLGEYLISCFEGYDFMVCFTFKSSLNKNYLKIEPIDKPFNNLFKEMIKSSVIKEAFLKDSEAVTFEYPYNNDDIINECEESIYYVPFPVSGFYGYTDKNSFKIYIYSNIKVDSIINTFTEYDNFLKTKTQEFKHISRIYFHLFNPSFTLSTPTTDENNKILIELNLKDMREKKDKIREAFESRTINLPEIEKMDFGDIFEMFFVGNKTSKFFLANIIFCLKESNWKLKSDIFLKNYIESIKQKNIFIQKNKVNYPFITSILEYFKFENEKIYFNELITKGSSKENIDKNKSGYFDNVCTYKKTYSHYNFTK